MRRIACVLVTLLGGCGLYFGTGGGGGGGVCNAPVPVAEPLSSLRDPYTGQCEQVGGYQCGECGPCTESGTAMPNWASCASGCLGKMADQCEATSGCQAEFLDASYWGCFPVEPYGEVQPPPGGCASLTADTCTQLDSCIAVYTSSSPADATKTSFAKCVDEAPPPPPPPPPPACTTLTTEADCLARSDCDATYTGYDCTCDSNGCVCKTEVFASCEPR